jgi:hypothetical protein
VIGACGGSEGDRTGTSAAVVVTDADLQQATLKNAFTIIGAGPPELSGIFPNVGLIAGGDTLQLWGLNFDVNSKVTIGGLSASVQSVSVGNISVTTPAHPPAVVDVLVTNPDGRKSVLPGAFSYMTKLPPPTLVGVEPDFGSVAGGDGVTLSGYNIQPSASVLFGGISVPLNYVGWPQLVLTPAHAAGTVDVEIINPDGQHVTLKQGYTFK